MDCSKTESAIEQAICHDPRVSALDQELTQSIERVLQQHPDKRDEILFDERVWVDTRDGRCEHYEDAGAAEGMRRCLQFLTRPGSVNSPRLRATSSISPERRVSDRSRKPS